MIPVTKPFLPPKEEYLAYIDGIWKRNWLTNNGPLVNELELKLKEYLNLSHLLYTSNGTIALQIAIKALDLTGEIITTPFSYVATTSSIVWEGCQPVFVDIDANTFNIDPSKIETAITPKTTAILATHVFGNPCDIDAIDIIARKHNLKVIYDGAHCFGTTYKGKSVFEYGDVATASFHATKLFHTIEGGALITSNTELTKKMSLMRNFGHSSLVDFDGVGINGKNSEFHAAMGLANLNHINHILARRKSISEHYDHVLRTHKGIHQKLNPFASYNYAYYPLIFDSEETLVKSNNILNGNMIYPRRYFHPSLTTLNYVLSSSANICEDISKRILCLPLYDDLSFEEVDFIARLLLRVQNN